MSNIIENNTASINLVTAIKNNENSIESIVSHVNNDFINSEKLVSKITYNLLDDNQIEMRYDRLPAGVGLTIANALRRTIISSSLGYKITGIRIKGVEHEFSSIPGIQEDYIQLMLNIKSLVIKNDPSAINKVFTVKVNGPAIVTAQDFNFEGELEIVPGQNQALSDIYICSITSGILELDFFVTKGIGYKQSHQHDKDNIFAKNMLLLDTSFSPILQVSYKILENLDGEEVVLTVKTNGAVNPIEIIKNAVSNLISYLQPIAPDFKINFLIDKTAPTISNLQDDILSITIDSPSISLSERSKNALRMQKIHTIGDIITLTEEELSNIKNIGKGSKQEIKDLLKRFNLSLVS